jgi:hypothetical protein
MNISSEITACGAEPARRGVRILPIHYFSGAEHCVHGMKPSGYRVLATALGAHLRIWAARALMQTPEAVK